MSHSTTTTGVRQARKQQTRRALLDAALELLADQSLSSLGMREVTRVVGVAPTAFYRHFRDISDLGVALVEEALGSLHAMIRLILADGDGADRRIDRTVEAITAYVLRHRSHVRFIARERHGGVRAVREAIAGQLERFVAEVAAALAVHPDYADWSADDLGMLAELYVDHMVMTASALLEASPGPAQERIVNTARRQLRLINLGCRHWREE
ncbi:TetR family transcriptional regulator [Streptomyces capparidis]